MRSFNIIHPYGKHLCTNKLQDIKTQNPSTRAFQGTRSEDRIVCKIGFVLTTKIHGLKNTFRR